MNLPNRLTVARIFLSPICVAVIMLKNVMFSDIIGAFIFLIVAITDMLDGRIARKRGLVTDFGKFLDPLADKFLVVGTLIALIYRSTGHFTLALVIMTIITIFREFAVSSMRLVVNNKANIVVAANLYGKIKTVSQIVFIVAFLIEPTIFDLAELILPVPEMIRAIPPVTTLAYLITIAFTVISGVIYIKSYMPYISADK